MILCKKNFLQHIITSYLQDKKWLMDTEITITTFNSLNNPDRKEERVEALFQELEAHGSQIVLLQEVLTQTLPLIQAQAHIKGWHVSVGEQAVSNPSKISGNVTLSRYPIESQFNLHTPPADGRLYIPTLITHFTNNITAINAHLVWGGDAEQYRLETAYQINLFATYLKEQEPDRLIVVGGDFNAGFNSATLRYLNGDHVYKNTSTFWTNAWDFAEETFPTARKDGGWAETTANNVGIGRPDLMPTRTIDHLLVFGWNYGKKHCPMELTRFGETILSNGYGLSDHYGLTSKIALVRPETMHQAPLLAAVV